MKQMLTFDTSTHRQYKEIINKEKRICFH